MIAELADRYVILATCPRCGRRSTAMVTAYGWRAVCVPCDVRLTWIYNQDTCWQVERR